MGGSSSKSSTSLIYIYSIRSLFEASVAHIWMVQCWFAMRWLVIVVSAPMASRLTSSPGTDAMSISRCLLLLFPLWPWPRQPKQRRAWLHDSHCCLLSLTPASNPFSCHSTHLHLPLSSSPSVVVVCHSRHVSRIDVTCT